MVQWKIFISFRGEDTRLSFTGFLYDALCREGFDTFMDDGGGLRNGDQISSTLSNAIEASRLSIVVLSENYASSSWCLDELAKILECKQSKNQLVWPIFYKVEPSNIRKLESSFGESLTKHEQQLGSYSERLQKWRSALFEVSNLSGHVYKTGFGYEYKLTQKIVQEASMLVQVDVEIEKNKLVSNQDLVRVKVETTDKKTELVSDVVLEWLKETDILIQEVESFTVLVQARRQQWNEFMKLLKKLMAQNKKYELLDPFSNPIPSLEHFSFGNIVCFNSREKTSDQLLATLQDDNCSLIGLYGRHGCGKTTLVKAMGEKVKYLKIFREVLFARVTQNPNIRTMQDEIADSLNMKFDRNSEAGRARRIFSTIESMNGPILVIFDDVRAKFDPEDVGIPCNSNHCKILFATCCREDCELMYCQRDIQLDPLSKEESWTLFQKYSGIQGEEYPPSFNLNVAREVAFECEGLPKRIKDVGSSLRSKPIEEWKTTLYSLKYSMAKWQIFLSFRGEDTCYSFTGYLYQTLSEEGFKTFMDDGRLHTGDQISPSLLNAIEASRLSIIVLSENYANSSWYLEELVKIMECVKLNGQIVWPIFHKVNPSDIRHLRKNYGKAMAYHEKIFGVHSEKVRKWKSALFEVSTNLSGKVYTTGYEYEFIQKIVEDANRIKSRLQIRNG